jgi:VanZ family protein
MKHWMPAVLFALLIFFVSAQSHPPGASLAPDYVAHFLEYGLFSLTLVWALTSGLKKRLTGRRALIAWLLALTYAATDELHQRFIPHRHSSLKDVVVDVVGAGIFILLVFLFSRYRKRAPEPR